MVNQNWLSTWLDERDRERRAAEEEERIAAQAQRKAILAASAQARQRKMYVCNAILAAEAVAVVVMGAIVIAVAIHAA